MIFHAYLRGIFYPVIALGVCDHQHTELNVKHKAGTGATLFLHKTSTKQKKHVPFNWSATTL